MSNVELWDIRNFGQGPQGMNLVEIYTPNLNGSGRWKRFDYEIVEDMPLPVVFMSIQERNTFVRLHLEASLLRYEHPEIDIDQMRQFFSNCPPPKKVGAGRRMYVSVSSELLRVIFSQEFVEQKEREIREERERFLHELAEAGEEIVLSDGDDSGHEDY